MTNDDYHGFALLVCGRPYVTLQRLTVAFPSTASVTDASTADSVVDIQELLDDDKPSLLDVKKGAVVVVAFPRSPENFPDGQAVSLVDRSRRQCRYDDDDDGGHDRSGRPTRPRPPLTNPSGSTDASRLLYTFFG